MTIYGWEAQSPISPQLSGAHLAESSPSGVLLHREPSKNACSRCFGLDRRVTALAVQHTALSLRAAVSECFKSGWSFACAARAARLEVFGPPHHGIHVSQRCLTNSLWAVAKLGLRGEDCGVGKGCLAWGRKRSKKFWLRFGIVWL